MKDKFTITPLGGVGQIGSNCTLIQTKNDNILIDCGILFPYEDFFDLNYLIPDLTEVSHWYLCGPQSMTEMVQNILVDNDIDEDRIQRELFTSAVPKSNATKDTESAIEIVQEELSADKAPRAPQKISVIYKERSIDFDWDEGNEVILNQALKQNEDLPHACQFGACGTCKARLIEGSAEMKDNMSIEEDEVNKGYILTCQAVPTSDRVVISYDE